jgi:magnesium chelatase accessory protein
MIALNPLVPRLFAWRAGDEATIDGLLRGTGSTLDAEGVALYRLLARNPTHVAGALAMMANWDLPSLERDLPRLQPQLTLVVGDQDGTIPPATALRVQSLLPQAERIALPGLGHLAHEEQPDTVARIIIEKGRSGGVLPSSRRRANG